MTSSKAFSELSALKPKSAPMFDVHIATLVPSHSFKPTLSEHLLAM